jgi:hypothetical protein
MSLSLFFVFWSPCFGARLFWNLGQRRLYTARKDIKAGKSRLKDRQRMIQRQAKKDSKAGKERLIDKQR